MSDWDARLLEEAARIAPEPAVAAALAGLERWPEVAEYDHFFCTARLRTVVPGLSFVRQAPKGRRASATPKPGYDAEIGEGRVPSRAHNWHDLFNALIWSAMPAAKRAVHARQRGMIAAHGDRPAGARSREQDALAMLDEGGLLLACKPGDEARIDEGMTRPGGLDALTAQGVVRPVIFGHALLEHLARGHRGMRGFPLRISVTDPGDLEAIDEALVGEIERLGPPGDRPGIAVPAPFFGARE